MKLKFPTDMNLFELLEPFNISKKRVHINTIYIYVIFWYDIFCIVQLHKLYNLYSSSSSPNCSNLKKRHIIEDKNSINILNNIFFSQILTFLGRSIKDNFKYNFHKIVFIFQAYVWQCKIITPFDLSFYLISYQVSNGHYCPK